MTEPRKQRCRKGCGFEVTPPEPYITCEWCGSTLVFADDAPPPAPSPATPPVAEPTPPPIAAAPTTYQADVWAVAFSVQLDHGQQEHLLKILRANFPLYVAAFQRVGRRDVTAEDNRISL